jgi:hypothetical protein
MTSNRVFTGVPSTMIDAAWPSVEGFIVSALEYCPGRYTAEHIKEFLKKRDFQLWVVAEGNSILGCALTEIAVFPLSKICVVRLAGAENTIGWLEYEGIIAAWARQEGASEMEIYGRPGWVKKMKNKGYRATMVTVVRKL